MPPLPEDERAALRAAILERHKTVYAFCKACRVTKSVVVQLLRGTYPGDTARQTARVKAALEAGPAGAGGPVVTRAQLVEALGREACAKCRAVDRRRCRFCRALWERQADAVLGLISHVA